ncbi:primosomal protein N' [Granulicoccus phenolivorans]|uniref:primosomal protein N' n=1 Tax=Granulicoccus phenolivorans TaxID=266854 RepID=UPI0003F6BB0D|nr:primosomal protein N' [Granulicoccus phenolivorans]
MTDSLLTLAPREAPEVEVARVCVDMPLPHLDRLFDYVVPAELGESAQPGVRVRVRFAGRLRDGFVIERTQLAPDPSRPLAPLEKVVSPEPVLTAEVARTLRRVADHFAGSLCDLTRLAVPPRHAATEKAKPPERPPIDPALAEAAPNPWTDYPAGESFLQALRAGRSPRALWQVAPAAARVGDWPLGLAQAAAATAASGRGCVIVVPDTRDLARLEAACEQVLGRHAFVTLHADTGPAARYRAFLAALRGQVKVVIGTRAAAYAPVPDPGLLICFDDGDDLHQEPRAPYPHVREVLALRAAESGAGLLLAGFARSCEAEHLVRTHWLTPIELPAREQRRHAPGVRIAAATDFELERDPLARAVRVPHEAFEAIRAGLAAGPVLIQVPRTGYVVTVSCVECAAAVRCTNCGGPVGATRDGAACRWCATPVTDWVCPECGADHWRAPVIGAERTAEEFGRAFPNTAIVQSHGEHILAEVDDRPALVIATPGAEPVAAGGYAAAILLDTPLLLGRADLRAAEEALRRWLNLTALVRPGADGGTVLAVGPTSSRALQALVRCDPAGFAARELAERFEAHLPPAVKLVSVEGGAEAVDAFAEHLELPPVSEVLGPLVRPGTGAAEATEPLAQLILRAPLHDGAALVHGVRAVVSVRSARKEPGALRVRVNPELVL